MRLTRCYVSANYLYTVSDGLHEAVEVLKADEVRAVLKEIVALVEQHRGKYGDIPLRNVKQLLTRLQEIAP